MPYVSKEGLANLPKAEYVYLLQDVEVSGLYKIGRTTRPEKRIVDEFGVQLPFKIEVLRMIPTYNAAKLERELHRKYAHRRTNGEWFDLQDNEVLEILSRGSELEPPKRPDKPPLFKSGRRSVLGKLTAYNIESLSSLHRVSIWDIGNSMSIQWTQGVNRITDHIYTPSEERFQIRMRDFPDTVSGAYEMSLMLQEAVDIAQQLK